jgi:hypothetical protein
MEPKNFAARISQQLDVTEKMGAAFTIEALREAGSSSKL